VNNRPYFERPRVAQPAAYYAALRRERLCEQLAKAGANVSLLGGLAAAVDGVWYCTLESLERVARERAR
jgi:hypothetical protein